ncbi:hypothetical protein DPMN_186817 [Dreissena polymorpha]|uniref:Uncharacterized protein n=1 Tax=Dreissena polymorpha TaxID=45954 RepID=A0A9D4DMV9_DREPO|nr:hypothetical protein DPMN_186817 [Dreissena polymorpha]
MPDLELAELPESDYEEDQTDDLECAEEDASERVIVFPCGIKRKRTNNMPDLESAELPESDYEEEQTDDLEFAKKKASEGVIVFPCGIIMKKRNKQKVMSWHHIPLNKDSEEHYRQQIMLFTAWRNEEKDLIGCYESYEAKFNAVNGEIVQKKLSYEQTCVDTDLYEQILRENGNNEMDTTATNLENQHREATDVEEGLRPSQLFGCFDPVSFDNSDMYDLGEDIGVSNRITPCEVIQSSNANVDFSTFRISECRN